MRIIDSVTGSVLYENNGNTCGAYLRRADLQDADLRGTSLRRADLRDANLRRADLVGADLRGADLRGADLRSAYMWGADLRGADLRGASLHGAKLEDADLEGTGVESKHYEEYVVVNNNGVITIGCETYSAEDWASFTDERIVEMDGEKALGFWRKHKEEILQ